MLSTFLHHASGSQSPFRHLAATVSVIRRQREGVQVTTGMFTFSFQVHLSIQPHSLKMHGMGHEYTHVQSVVFHLLQVSLHHRGDVCDTIICCEKNMYGVSRNVLLNVCVI